MVMRKTTDMQASTMRLYIYSLENSLTSCLHKSSIPANLRDKYPPIFEVTTHHKYRETDLTENENRHNSESLASSGNIFKCYQVGIVLCAGTREQKTNSFLALATMHYFL